MYNKMEFMCVDMEVGYDGKEYPIFSPMCPETGGPVKKTKDEYRYSYDPFVIWRGNGFDKDKNYLGDYSDRLFQWNSDRYNECCEQVWGNKGQYFDCRTPEEIQKFLQLYYGDDNLVLYQIVEGCNQGNGYPYWIFYTKEL